MTEEEKRFLSKLLKALGIDPGPEGIDTFERIVELIKEAGAQKMAAAAISEGKLGRDEYEWFMTLAQENGLGCVAAFLKMRKPIPAILQRLEHKGENVPNLDEIQRQINKQCGISDETFLKFTPQLRKEAETQDDLQKRINRQCGVSDELFAKYARAVSKS